MSTPDAARLYLSHPERLGHADEGLHAPPDGAGDALWGDSFWLSVPELEAGVLGVNHFFITNRGFGRYQAHYWIDGVQQSYSRKVPAEATPGAMTWSDGNFTYEVVKPFEVIRLTMDNPKYAFDLEFRGRFPAFDYEDCAGGSPQAHNTTAAYTGGHYEQAMTCRGSFEIRGGPAAGETRRIDCLSHRDHSWTNRFASETPWEYPDTDSGMHYWLALGFPDRGLNVVGFFDGDARPGGFESSTDGNRVVVDAAILDEGPLDLRHRVPGRYRAVLADGETLHVRVLDEFAKAKLQMLGEDDAESRIDDWETLLEVEIEETGERGYGVIEHSMMPPRPRWLI